MKDLGFLSLNFLGVNCLVVSDSETPWTGAHPGSSVREILQARVLDAAAAKSLQSCPALCNPIDGSPPGPSVHRIL